MFNQIKKRLNSIGPGALIAAAFIGPGTVTTCSLAGANFGYALLWGLSFSAIATIVLQSMSVRLGIIAQKDLGSALRESFQNKWLRLITIGLVLLAIFIGNAAYETGNILGGAIGIEALTGISKFHFGDLEIHFWGPLIGIAAFVLLYVGNYKILEKALLVLIILMSITFLSTAFLIKPQIIAVLKGAFIPQIPKGSTLTIIGLIGTTVVPYNLFLHSSAVKEKWKLKSDLKYAKSDLYISILLGVVISMSIVITSASAFFGSQISLNNAGDLAIQLEPLLGNWAKAFIGIGLFSAGISSSITAPLAAAYAITGVLGWKSSFNSTKFRAIWMTVLGVGIVLSAFNFKPLKAILVAQATNGILLPILAFFLIWVVNNKKFMGTDTNKLSTNIIGLFIVLLTLGLGIKSLLSVFGLI